MLRRPAIDMEFSGDRSLTLSNISISVRFSICIASFKPQGMEALIPHETCALLWAFQMISPCRLAGCNGITVRKAVWSHAPIGMYSLTCCWISIRAQQLPLVILLPYFYSHNNLLLCPLIESTDSPFLALKQQFEISRTHFHPPVGP